MKTKISSMTAGLCVLLLALTLCIGVPTAKAATEENIETAIANGLTWLVAQQQPDGSWRYGAGPSSMDVAVTGLVVLKFEDRAKELGLDPFDIVPGSPTYYEYATNVIAGLDYIFGHAVSDANGVHFAGLQTYTTSIAMMAVAASNAPTRTITTGVLSGNTYLQALQGMTDWMVYAQQINLNYSCDEGGWAYQADPTDVGAWADQSNTGYAALGLSYAQAPAPDGFGLAIPPTVLPRLSTYINNIQDPIDLDNWDGGSWYELCTGYRWVNILKTGNLLHEMALVGDSVSSVRAQNAIKYIQNHWNDTGPQPEFSPTSLGWKDSYQAMFTMMKGFEAFGIKTITVGTIDIDWFDQVSDVVVAKQNADGSWQWINPAITEGEQSPVLRAAWAMLTLERVVPTVIQSVYVDIKPTSCPNPLNRKSKGVVPVAILGTDDFDVATIDPLTIKLSLDANLDGGVAPLRFDFEDVATPYENGEECGCHELGPDDYMDLTLKFSTQDLVGLNLGDSDVGDVVPLILTGNLLESAGGTPIIGQDCVLIVK